MGTENVTVLFTDMVDSTALGADLAPAAADDLRRTHFTLLREALAVHDGTEVKSLGDGVMVVFSSAAAAVSCAVAMQQAIAADNRQRERSVGLRVGVSGGEATCEDDDYFGEPVIEAARLCAQCDTGQILVAEVVRLMVGRRTEHTLTPRGQLTLKGLPDPVDVHEVEWTRDQDDIAASVPLPARLARRPSVGFVGRGAEIERLLDAGKLAGAEQACQICLVSGDPGLGKTTLVAEAGRQLAERGALVLYGHCEDGLAQPYGLFAEALGHLVTHLGEAPLRRLVGNHADDLGRLLPTLPGGRSTAADRNPASSDSERFQLFAAVVAILGRLGRQTPVVLVLDDLQWADRSSMRLLEHLATTENPLPLLVIGTYRDRELSMTHPLLATLAALRRGADATRIQLAGLDDLGVLHLMELAAGHELEGPSVDLARAVFRETDGNPFFVTEILRQLVETGTIRQDDDGRWITVEAAEAIELPDSVREVIGMRVGALGPEAVHVLTVAAAIGRDFDIDLLVLACDRSIGVLADVLDASQSASLVVPVEDVDGRYRFRHALINHTLLDDLGAPRLAQVHRAVAVAIESLPAAQQSARLGQLAHHWAQAVRPVDVSRALEYCQQAAEHALASLAPADALGHFERAIELERQVDVVDPGSSLDLRIGLGVAQRQTGDPQARATLLDATRAAVARGDAERSVAAILASSRGWSTAVGVVDHEKVGLLEQVIDVTNDRSAERALTLASLCSELCWGTPLERRRELAAEAESIAHEIDDDALVARVLNDVALSLLVPPMVDVSDRRTAEALERAQRVGDPVLEFFANVWRAVSLGLSGDLPGRVRCTERAGQLARRLDEPTINWSQLVNRAVCAMAAGDPALVDELAEAALEVARDTGQPDAATYYGTEQTVVHWQRGTLGELGPLLEATASDLPELRVATRANLALSDLEGGRTDAARSILDTAAAEGYESPIDHSWLTSMVLHAEVAVELGLVDHAAALYEWLAPWDHLTASTGNTYHGPVSLWLGALCTVLGRYSDAERHFATTRTGLGVAHGDFVAARLALWNGRMLLASDDGRDAEARAMLERARRLADDRGYGAVARRAAAALQAAA